MFFQCVLLTFEMANLLGKINIFLKTKSNCFPKKKGELPIKFSCYDLFL